MKFPAFYGTRRLFTVLTSARGQIEKNEMGRTCGAYGGGKRGAQGVGVET
jgi:hypothetical protein